LKGVLKSGGLLAGSAFTLDKDGVSNFRFTIPFLLVELGRGVESPSSLVCRSVPTR